MKKFLTNQSGFGLIETVLVFVMIAAVGGVVYTVVGNNDKKDTPAKTTSQPTSQTTPVKNPFPAKPTVTATGEWQGRYSVKNPDACAGEEGGWKATLSEKDGILSGSYSADGGSSGTIKGELKADKATWDVSNGSNGVSFNGTIAGNTMSGDFTGVRCSTKSPERTTGTFFGGRTVQ